MNLDARTSVWIISYNIDIFKMWVYTGEMQQWIVSVGWEIAVVVAGILSGVAQSIGKRQVERMSSFQSGILRDGTILFVMVVLVLMFGGGEWNSYSWVWILMGLLESVMMAAYYSASRTELASTVIFSYPLSSVLIVLFSGIMFGEWQYFDFRTIEGIFNIVSLFLIIWLMLTYQGSRLQKTRWSTKIFLSSLMVVVSNLMAKWAVSTLGLMPAGYMVYEYLGLVVGGLAYVLLRRQGVVVGVINTLWGVVQGLLFSLSILIFAEVLKIYPLSLASLVRRVTIVLVTVAVSMLWYKEGKGMKRGQWLRLLGAVFVLLVMMWVNR